VNVRLLAAQSKPQVRLGHDVVPVKSAAGDVPGDRHGRLLEDE
jgi:hypothetical protein